ncbi:MAG: hypothetical protein JXQ73_00685 [Phycisphaerae bacterium]|nr:hypothetical protein [Phycisphaerae bacterium]
MLVTLLCPNLRCRRVLQVPDTTRGHRVRCGHCGQILTVPTKQQQKAKASKDPRTTQTPSA